VQRDKGIEEKPSEHRHNGKIEMEWGNNREGLCTYRTLCVRVFRERELEFLSFMG
jgi:hypothetical protein